MCLPTCRDDFDDADEEDDEDGFGGEGGSSEEGGGRARGKGAKQQPQEKLLPVEDQFMRLSEMDAFLQVGVFCMEALCG